jgi:histone deacetylase complex regulatory component SIN3
MNALSYVSSEELYNEFIETVTALTNETISKEEGLKVLEKLLQYKDYPSLIFDKNEFEEIVNKLIEEIKKL